MAGQSDNKYGDRDSKPLTGVSAPVSETKASLTIQTALKLEAKALGTLGNSVTVKAEANTSDNLAVSVTGNALTILLANTTVGKNTMTLIAALIASTPTANALVNAIVITGSTQMTAFTVQSLSGGLNGSIGYLSEVRYDTNSTKWELKYIDSGCYYWSPDGFPVVDTEYFNRYNVLEGKKEYKSKVRHNSPSVANSASTFNMYFANCLKVIRYSTVQYNSATVTINLPWGPTGSILTTSSIYAYLGDIYIYALVNNSGYLNKPCESEFYYTKE